MLQHIENVKEQHQGEAESQSIQRERKHPLIISDVGMSAPARKAVPLTRAKANSVSVCVCYNIENVKEQHQGEAETQSIQRERKHT